MQRTIQIVSGPSREELFDGLRLFAEKRLVVFRTLNNGSFQLSRVKIQGIALEDGSGDSWNVTISIDETFLREMPSIDLRKQNKRSYVSVVAYYSTKSRTGTITVPF